MKKIGNRQALSAADAVLKEKEGARDLIDFR